MNNLKFIRKGNVLTRITKGSNWINIFIKKLKDQTGPSAEDLVEGLE